MTTVALYSTQPILTAGFQSVIAALDSFALPAVFTSVDALIEQVLNCPPSVILLDITEGVALTTLSRMKEIMSRVPLVLWANSPSTEFVSQALALGVRGILRRSLPIDLQIKCLAKVAAGDLWVEQGLCQQILTTKRICLTRRERQMMSLLAQGMKNKEIAFALSLTEGTVKVYLSRLFRKVGASDRFELALFALKHVFLEPSAVVDLSSAPLAGSSPAATAPLFLLPNFVFAETSTDALAVN